MSSTGIQLAHSLDTNCEQAIRKAVVSLSAAQHTDGYWWGDLTADSTLESDYILLQLWLHPPVNGVWSPPNHPRVDRAIASILQRQLPDGGFNIFPGGPSDLNATVKAYFALKLSGIPVDDPRLAQARERILERGGLQKANSYVKLNLSLFGLYPRQYTPSVPPELILFGNFLYEMSSWSRAIVVPLAIVHAANPNRPVPARFDLKELWGPGAPPRFLNGEGFFSWHNFFLTVDAALKVWERFGPTAIRRKAIRRCEQWMVERTRYSGGLGAIYPPMMYAIMAFDVLGYAADHPDRQEALRQFEALMVDDERGFFFQPCFSPVWDTAILTHAMGESGMGAPAVLEHAASWLLTKEVRRKGDWSVKRPNVEPSGWYFEFANEFYPDIDDTAMVLIALSQAKSSRGDYQRKVIERATNWLLAMQSKDGGWAAFDVDNNWDMLSAVPFADHNAMLDPTCPDITGRVMEALVASGVEPDSPAIQRGVAYLLRTQEDDGSWHGRWGVNYVYGTFLALRGLQAAGVSDREAAILRAGEWLRCVQNADGGWGESCASYDQNAFVPAPSTASQTAWAVLGLIAGGDTNSLSVQNGIEFLLNTQGPEGRWREELATGTGFPRVFYLQYHLYRDSFPLLALSTYRKLRQGARR
ncbi:MAG: squalene--hopene cyclase [Bryobacterales bacterium]|nr:squalene--hopene cyclase [Bryobacterales bacterium]